MSHERLADHRGPMVRSHGALLFEIERTGEMKRTTVQIVEVEDGKETHVRKLTIYCPAEEVLDTITEIFKGHLVNPKKRAENGGDLPQKQA